MKKTELFMALVAAGVTTVALAELPSEPPTVVAAAQAAKPAGVALDPAQKQILDDGVAAIERKLSLTFKNIEPKFLGPGPLSGLYEMLVGGRIIYYAPEKNWLLFGEFFSPDGISQTQQRLQQLYAAEIEDLPLEQAITVGEGPTEVIEFVDPDCPYCRRWNDFAKQHPELKRRIFLVPLDGLHPSARGKSEHILCAEDPAQTLEDFYAGRIGTDRLVGCDAGKRRLTVHEDAARKLGLTGTPTLVIAGQVITGFNSARVQTLLSKEE